MKARDRGLRSCKQWAF